jgi:hypothetical protein
LLTGTYHALESSTAVAAGAIAGIVIGTLVGLTCCLCLCHRNRKHPYIAPIYRVVWVPAQA